MSDEEPREEDLIACRPCSVAGGADGPVVYHLPPACDDGGTEAGG